MQAEQQQEGFFPIGTVSNMTGVNSVTLRAWERRYGLIVPTRTPSGHRLYSESDIERIKLILQLLDEGIAISRVKEALRLARQESEPTKTPAHWNNYQEKMLDGVFNFDEAALDSVYNEAMSLYPVDVVTRQLLLPLLEKLGQRWMTSSTGVAEEHFFSTFMRNKLGARFHHRNQQNTGGPLLIAACLPGEHHEFGLLLFSLTAHARGYRLILLGSDMPLGQLAEVAKRSNSDGIVLSGAVDIDPLQLHDNLQQVITDSGIPVWVGGKTSEKFREEIESAGAHAIGFDLIVGLHAINKRLPVRR
jgi:DNA-binding transcriptional MerR regulator